MDVEEPRELMERAKVMAALSAQLINRAKATVETSKELLQLTEDLARASEALRQQIDTMHEPDGGR
jgi:hypothetical protein